MSQFAEIKLASRFRASRLNPCRDRTPPRPPTIVRDRQILPDHRLSGPHGDSPKYGWALKYTPEYVNILITSPVENGDALFPMSTALSEQAPVRPAARRLIGHRCSAGVGLGAAWFIAPAARCGGAGARPRRCCFPLVSPRLVHAGVQRGPASSRLGQASNGATCEAG